MNLKDLHNDMKIIFLILFLSVSCLLIGLPYVSACTVWGAAGEKVKIKGTVIAKNRDNAPHLFSSPRLSFPVNGYKFFGLYDIEADGFVIAGINEKHLAVFNASVTSVPKAKREVAKEDTTERLLMTFDSVDAVLLRKDIFKESHPAIYLIADARKISVIEVAPDGKISIKQTNNGALSFTNHYNSPELAYANENTSPNSIARFKRINYFIESTKQPFEIDDFISISEDKAGRSNNSIWITKDTSSKVRTLASLIISIPEAGLPEVYVKIANPGEKEMIIREKLDFSIWSKKLFEKDSDMLD